MLQATLGRRSWLAAISSSVAAAALPLRAQPTAATARLMSLRDASRQRDLPVLLRLPTGSGPWPVVVYSHGLGGSRQGGDAWGEAWRSQGIAVLHVQHPGSDVEVLREGGPDQLREAATAEQLATRARDIRFVIDEIARAPARQGSPLANLRIDAVGLAGHSFGAWTVLAVAGQQIAAIGGEMSDSRPRAFLALSPSLPQVAGAAASLASVRRPLLAATGSLDSDPLTGTRNGESRAAVYEALPGPSKALLWLEGADHATFGGQSPRRTAIVAAAAEAGGAAAGLLKREPVALEREARHHALLGRLSALWWRAHLLDDADATAQLKSPTGLGTGDRWKAEP